jgi:hypothetical protein
LLEITIMGIWPPAASPQQLPLGEVSFSSSVTITVELEPVNQLDVSTGPRLFTSQVLPSATVPSCMSSIRLGVIQTKSGALLPSRVETIELAPG